MTKPGVLKPHCEPCRTISSRRRRNPLGAIFLGPGPAERVAEIVEHGVGRLELVDLDHRAVEKEADHLGNRLRLARDVKACSMRPLG